VRRYQLHLTASGVGVPTLNQTVSTLRFFFKVTLGRPDLVERTAFVREPRKLPVVLSPDEVARLLDAAPGLKYKAALSVAYGAGLRVSEVMALKIGDIDSKRMVDWRLIRRATVAKATNEDGHIGALPTAIGVQLI
jgi:integrase/recombinase XerD